MLITAWTSRSIPTDFEMMSSRDLEREDVKRKNARGEDEAKDVVCEDKDNDEEGIGDVTTYVIATASTIFSRW